MGPTRPAYLAEDGPLVDGRYELLGGVGVFNVRLVSMGIEYRFGLCEKPRARSASWPGGKPWFADVRKDDKWLRDPDKKRRE